MNRTKKAEKMVTITIRTERDARNLAVATELDRLRTADPKRYRELRKLLDKLVKESRTRNRERVRNIVAALSERPQELRAWLDDGEAAVKRLQARAA